MFECDLFHDILEILPFASNRSAQTFLRLVLHSKRIRLTKRVRLAGKTCTFGQQNMYVLPTKHVRLANITCTFGRRPNIHVLLAKRTCFVGQTHTFCRPNVYVWSVKQRVKRFSPNGCLQMVVNRVTCACDVCSPSNKNANRGDFPIACFPLGGFVRANKQKPILTNHGSGFLFSLRVARTKSPSGKRA